MKTPILFLAASVFLAGCSSVTVDPAADRDAIMRTDAALLAGFAHGDVNEIMRYHHPDVAKALTYSKYLVGRDAVRADLTATLDQFRLEFVGHRVESLLVHGDTAIEQTAFEIKGTPKKGGEPFLFKGRAIVVYVRYGQSPTGWASIREAIQPATQ
jgi:ketosteroid isomerase-like protein